MMMMQLDLQKREEFDTYEYNLFQKHFTDDDNVTKNTALS